MKMPIARGFRILIAAAAVAGGAAHAQAPGAPLRAGAAKIEITPPASALPPGDSIRDPLFVRAIFVSDGATCAVLVGLDQSGAAQAVYDDAVGRASRSTGCPVGNFMISGTHTHSGSTPAPTALPSAQTVANAIVSAADQAKARARPARIGFGKTEVRLNTNRDQYEGLAWYQGTNREGPSDKTLAVVEFLGEDGMPIGIVVNYAMHAINFYLSGVISADFPGETSRYIERRYPAAVALFTQGASGDQNPHYIRPMLKLSGLRTHLAGAGDDRPEATDPWKVATTMKNWNADVTAQLRTPLPAAELPAYRAAAAEVGEAVTFMGALLGESAIDVMENLTLAPAGSGRIWAGERLVSCPGRNRIPDGNWQNFKPSYNDGDPANIRLGVLRIADVDFYWLNGELYSEIGQRMKRENPAKKMLITGLANGRSTAGYIYSNNASEHLTFQVMGSRLKPGCAEDALVKASLELAAEARR